MDSDFSEDDILSEGLSNSENVSESDEHSDASEMDAYALAAPASSLIITQIISNPENSRMDSDALMYIENDEHYLTIVKRDLVGCPIINRHTIFAGCLTLNEIKNTRPIHDDDPYVLRFCE